MIDEVHVLIVDDDTELTRALCEHLLKEGFKVTALSTFKAGVVAGSTTHVDVAVVNVVLPDGSGLDLFHAFRSRSSVPVLLLKTQGQSADRIRGLELGADDYLSKPCDPHELAVRVRAILRRTHGNARLLDNGKWLKAGALELSAELRKAIFAGKELNLTSVEFNLLEHLLRHCGTVVSREELVRVALGRTLGLLDRSVDVHLSRLRKKLEACGATEEHIKSVRGSGYMLAAFCASP
jgi:DNA-binding response OmpR family regulator